MECYSLNMFCATVLLVLPVSNMIHVKLLESKRWPKAKLNGSHKSHEQFMYRSRSHLQNMTRSFTSWRLSRILPSEVYMLAHIPAAIYYIHEKLNFQAMIKSTASAASPKTQIHESRGAQPSPPSACRAVVRWLPWIPGFWSSGRLR